MRASLIWRDALLLGLAGCAVGQQGSVAPGPMPTADPAALLLMAGNTVSGNEVDHCDDPVSTLETSALNTLCELLGGGDTCITSTSTCSSYRRELYAGSTLVPPGTSWTGRGSSGRLMADAAVCTLRELSSAKGVGPITSQASVNIGLGDVTVRQEVGYLDFNRTTARFEGYRKLTFSLPVLGKFDAISQGIDIRRAIYGTSFSSHPYAGSYLIDAGYGLDLASERKQKTLTITPPAFDIVTPIGTFQAQPGFEYKSNTAVSDAPWVLDHTDISLPPDSNGDPVFVRLVDLYGVIPGVEATTANAPTSSLALAPYRTGWTSQIALGSRGTGKDKIWSAPKKDPKSRPDYDPLGVLDFSKYDSRSGTENDPSVYVKASASLKYPENPKELLPDWVFSLPGWTATAYIKVTPTIEAGGAGQFGFALSEGTNYLKGAKEFSVNQSRFASLGLYSGVEANASFYIDTELRIKVSADFGFPVGTIDVIDVNPHFPVPLAGGTSGSPVRLATATSSSSSLTSPEPVKLDGLITFAGPKPDPKGFIEQCYAAVNDTPPENPPPTPTEKGKPEGLAPELWPCNICMATDAVIDKGSGKILEPAHSDFLSPASTSPTWKCDAKAKSGCMDLCAFDSLTKKLIVVKDPDKIAADIPASDPQHNFFLGCKQPPFTSVVVLVKQSPSGAAPVPVATNIAASFSAPLDVKTVNTSTVTLNPSVHGAVSYDSKTYTVTFTPSAPLDPGVTYTVTYARGISDTRGNQLAKNVTWTFITEQGGRAGRRR